MSEVVPGVMLGRVADARPELAVLDLTAELPAPSHPDWHCLPTLYLVAPDPGLLAEAADHIAERVAAGRPILVACALGYSRSAAAVCTWLVGSGRAVDLRAAVELVERARPQVVLQDAQLRAISAALDLRRREAA